MILLGYILKLLTGARYWYYIQMAAGISVFRKPVRRKYSHIELMLVCSLGAILFLGNIPDLESLDLFQLLRNQIWSLLPIVMIFVSFNPKSIDRLDAWLDSSIILVGATAVLDYIFGLNLGFYSINKVDSLTGLPRLYHVFIMFYFVKSILDLERNNYIRASLYGLIVLLCGGKATLVAFVILLIMSSIRQSVKFVIIGLAVSLFFFVGFAERFESLIVGGDMRRYTQLFDAYSQLSTPFKWLFGDGLARPYLKENYGTGLLEENAKFDIESGIPFLVLHFGLLGSTIMLWLYYRLFGLRLFLIWIALLLGWAPVGTHNLITTVALLLYKYRHGQTSNT